LPNIYGKRLREFCRNISKDKDIGRVVDAIKKLKMESGKASIEKSIKKAIHFYCFLDLSIIYFF
jgi:hypothetical protein